MRRLFFSRFLGLPILALAGREPEKRRSGTRSSSRALGARRIPRKLRFPSIMRSAVAGSVVPVGWPPLAEATANTLEHKVPVPV
jgi:hypothetical protein